MSIDTTVIESREFKEKEENNNNNMDKMESTVYMYSPHTLGNSALAFSFKSI